MKLSSKCRYGVRALFDIAYFARGGALQIKDISVRQAIPPRFLEQIFQDLKKAGLVTSKRGPRGGYQLATDPAEIRVGDVIKALEGPVDLRAAPAELGPAEAAVAVTEETFETLSGQFQEALDGITLASLCERAEAVGLGNQPSARRRYVYSI